MRVLIVYPRFFVYGGAELLIVRLCDYLSRQGVASAVLTSQMIPEVAKHLVNTEVIRVPHRPDFRVAGPLWRMLRKCAADYDLVNVHNYPAEFTAFMCRRPVVWMCNEPELYLSKISPRTFRGKLLSAPVFSLEKFIVRNYINAVVVSDAFNADRFHSVYGARPRIIPYGIDYDFFAAVDADQVAALRRRWNGRFVILHAGMMTSLKNQLQSLQTLCALKSRIPGVLLVLAGFWDQAYKAAMDKFIAEKGLADDVVFTGHVDRQKLRAYYQGCDVLLHPVRAQGGWLAPFEALSAGLPVVVSPEMTAAAMIASEKIGIITQDYAGVIAEMQQHPQTYQAMAQKGREWVRQNLSWDKFGEGMLGVFNATLAGKKTKALS